MKALFVYGELTLEKVGSTYHHNFLGDIINRYQIFGELTICTLVRETSRSSNAVVALDRVTHYALDKENTIYRRFLNRKHNRYILKREVRNADIVIIHFPSSAGNMAAHYARKYHKPYLAVVVGCPWDALWNYGYKGKLLAPISYWQTKEAVKKADYVQYVTQKFLQHRYPSNAFQIGCSDVCITSLDQSNSAFLQERVKNWSKSSCRHIATIGSVDVPFKGQVYVLEAIAKLNRSGYNYHYHLIGGGEGTSLKTLAHQLNIEEYVHFEGSIPHAKIFDKLREMDIYAQPSELEGLPRSIVEAMSIGLPVIASQVGGIPELVADEFMFDIGDVDAIVNILQSDNDNWLVQSKTNIERAANYLYDTLKCRRDIFMEKCCHDVASRL